MSSHSRKTWISRVFSTQPRSLDTGRRFKGKKPTKKARAHSPLSFEPLESRDVPAIIDLTVTPINPTEGVAFGTQAAPQPIAVFTVDNFLGFDQSSQFSAEIEWGDGGVTGGLAGPTIQFFQNLGAGRATYQVFSYHTYRHASHPLAPLDLDVEVFDNTGPGTSQASSAPIRVNDQALTATGVQPMVVATVGAPLTNVDVATFTDGNPLALAGDYSATITWGNPTQTTGGLVVRDTNGTFHVLASHTFDGTAPALSAYTVTVLDVTANVVMNNNASVNQASIEPTAATVTIVEGGSIPAGTAVGTFIDNGGGQAAAAYTATANFPNATGPTGLTVVRNGTTNQYTLTTTAVTNFNTPPLTGTSNYTLTVTAATGPTATTTGSLVVTNAALALVSTTPPAPVAGAPVTNFALMVFSDAFTTEPASSFTASINWGDGTANSVGTVTPLGGGQYEVRGSHTYTRPTPVGVTYQVTISVQDTGGGSVTGTTTPFAVADAAITPTQAINVFGSQGQPINDATVATFTSANPFATAANFSASINWGDGTGPQPAFVRLVGGSAGGTVFAVYGSHTFTTSGNFNTTYSVTSVGGAAPIVNAAGGVASVTQGAIVVSVLPLQATIDSPTTAGIVATFQDLGGADPVASYTANIDWGDGTPTTPGTIAALGGNQFSISAPAHTYTRTGLFVMRVFVTDIAPAFGVGGNLVTVQNSVMTVTPPGGPIVGAVEGAPLTTTVAAFTDTNTVRTAGSYVAVIDWGDGSPMSFGTVAGGGGTFTVTGTHTYADASANPYTVRTVITDSAGGRVVAVNSVNLVADAALTAGPGIPLFALQHQPLVNVPVGTFTDANPGGTAADFTALINWGDGSPATTGTVTLVGGTAAGAVFSVSGSHVYPSTLGSPYTITYSVVSTGGSTLINAPGGPATIAQGSIVVTALPFTTVIGTAIPAGVVATFLDVSGPDPLANYSATINWGDGTTSPGTIAALGGAQFSVSGPAHTYAQPGVYALKVTVVDIDPAVGIGGNLVFVQAATLTITPVGGGGGGGGGITTVEGTFLNDVPVATFTSTNLTAVPGNFSAVIDWGDGSPFSTGTITQPGGVGTAFLVTGDHTYKDYTAIGYPVTVTVTDNFGSRGTLTTNAAVADATLVSPTGIAQFASGGQALINAPLGTFADSNPLGEASDHTATINWGDGSPNSLGFVTLVGGNAAQAFFSVSGSHLYTSAGVKNVTITVQDEGGQLTVITTTVTVTGSSLGLQSFPITATEGIPTPANMLVGTFNDPSFVAGVTYQVTINWGDGNFDTNGTGVVVQQSAPGSTTFNILAPSHTYADHGTYVVTITVVGSNGTGPATAANLAVVRDAPLTGINGGTILGVEGTPIGFQTIVSFTDANPTGQISDFRATINWGDGTTSLGVISQPGGPGTVFLVGGNHTYRTDGQYAIYVEIIDVTGTSRTSATAQADIAQAPIAMNAAPLVIFGQQNIALVNRDVATFTSGNRFDTAGTFAASINWGDGITTAGTIVQDSFGVYHVQGTHTYTASGQYFPVITVTEVGDPALLGQVTANVTITATPLIVSSAPVNGMEGIALPNAQNATNGTVVATFVDVFGAEPVAAYTAMIDWGNGQVTPGTVLPGTGPNFVVVAPAAPPIIYTNVGAFTVRVTITNVDANSPGGFFTAFAVGTATIVDAPLVADPIQPVVNGFQQTPLLGVPVSRFTDTNPTGLATDFTATIDWGDGSPQSVGQVTQPGGPGTPFVVVGNHTYANATTPPAQPYAITVQILSDDGSRLTTRTTANITATTLTGTPVVINGVEGQPLVNVVVAYFSDSGIPGPLSSYSAMINWGTGLPGSTTFGQIVPIGGNNFQVMGSYTYPEENVAPGIPYSITVTVSHNGLPAVTIVSQANIADAPISGVAIPIFPIEGVQFHGTMAIFNDANPNGVATDFTATINWGDGFTSAGTVIQNGRTFFVRGTDPISGLGHIYTSEGTYTFSVTVTDQGGSSFTAFETATVQDGALAATGINSTIQEGPIAAVPGPGVVTPTFQVATFVDAGNTPGNVDPPSSYVATINWGDGVVTTGTIGNPTLVGPNVIYPVSGQHLYADNGVYQLTITIRTLGPAATSVSTTTAIITVTEAPLTAGPTTAITGVEGRSLTAQVATFTDANLAGVMGDFTATINWGDGTSSAGILGQISTPLGSPTQFTVTGTHTYLDESAPGTPYQITVSIRDLDGPTTTATATAAIGDAPLTSEGGTIRGSEGVSTGPVLIGTFTDTNPLSTIAEFTTPPASITIDWGDGTPIATLPASAITAVGLPSGVTYRVTAAHTYQNPGTYPITVQVNDEGGAAAIIQSVAEISGSVLTGLPTAGQPTIASTEGAIFSGPVFRFNDSDPTSTTADFSARIDWGDGLTDDGVITQPGGPGTTFVVSGTHRYLDNGNYSVGVIVNKVGGSTIAYQTTAVVTGVAPTAKITSNSPVDENSPVTVTLFDPQDPSPTDTQAGFRYSFATTAAGLATTYASAQAANSLPIVFPDGPATPTVFARIFDKDGLFTDYQTTVTVRNVPPTATFNVTGPFLPGKPLVATFSNQADVSPVDTAAGFTYSYDFGTGTFGPQTTSPSQSFTPTVPGVIVIRGRIYDKDGGFTEYTFNPNGAPPFVTIPNVDIFAIGNGIGGGPIVHVHRALDNKQIASFTAYEPTFRGGVLVGTGDVTGDGIPDVITGTGVGGGPVVKVFDGVTFNEIRSFFAYEDSFRGGVFVAAGDTDGDGRAEIITGVGVGGGPVVKVFDGLTGALRASFSAYDISSRGGVNVAVGDTTGDKKAEIITGAGVGGGPNVRVFDNVGHQLDSFFAYDAKFTGGVTVSAGDLFKTGRADIVTGTGAGGGSHLVVFDAQTHAIKRSFFAFGPDRITGLPLRNGFNVSASHIGGPTGQPLLIAAAGPDYGPTVRIFDPNTLSSLGEIVPYEDTFTGGAYVG